MVHRANTWKEVLFLYLFYTKANFLDSSIRDNVMHAHFEHFRSLSMLNVSFALDFSGDHSFHLERALSANPVHFQSVWD